ncbi:MAG: RdgB/HAM1 family non-canonical purine NTP pyrophosphatase [Candidatus Kapaibacterium sp.]|jgi:XTP/dITP diphosphohydrolase
MIFILATNNPHKREELLAILSQLVARDIEVRTLAEAGLDDITIEETGATLEENASIKSRTIFDLTQIPTIADDTGLEVEALGGAPGVYSARYAGEAVTYADNVNKLMIEMHGKTNRAAAFRTIISFIDHVGREHQFEGTVEGSIAFEPIGTQGFGYDSVFLPNEANGKTFAEMSAEEKNKISHRGRALRKFAEYLIT